MVHYVKLLSSLAQRLSNGEGRHALGKALARRTFINCQGIVFLHKNPSIPLKAHECALRVMVSIPEARRIMKDAKSLRLLSVFFHSMLFMESPDLIDLKRICVSHLVSADMPSLTTLELIVAANILIRHNAKVRRLQVPSESSSTPLVSGSPSASYLDVSPQDSIEGRIRELDERFPAKSYIQLAVELLTEVARRLPHDHAFVEDKASEGLLPGCIREKKYSYMNLSSQSNTTSVHEDEMGLFVEGIKNLMVICSVKYSHGEFDQNLLQEINKNILRPVVRALPQHPLLVYFSQIVKTRPLLEREAYLLVDIILVNDKSFIEIGVQKIRKFFELSKPGNFFLGFTAVQAIRKWNSMLHEFPTYTSLLGWEGTLTMFDALAPLLETQFFFTKDFPEGVNFVMKRPFFLSRMTFIAFTACTALCETTHADRAVSLRYLGSLERVMRHLLLQMKEAIQNGWGSTPSTENDKRLAEVTLLRALVMLHKARKLVTSPPAADDEHRFRFISTEELLSYIKTSSDALILLPKGKAELSAESLDQQASQLLWAQAKFRIWGDLVELCLELVETRDLAAGASSSDMEFYLRVLNSLLFFVRHCDRPSTVLTSMKVVLKTITKELSRRSASHIGRISQRARTDGPSEAALLQALLGGSLQRLRAGVEAGGGEAEGELTGTGEGAKGGRNALLLTLETLQLGLLLGLPAAELGLGPTLGSFLVDVLHVAARGEGKGKPKGEKDAEQGRSRICDALEWMRVAEAVLRYGLGDEAVLAAVAAGLRGGVTEDALRGFGHGWRPRIALARSAGRVYALVGPHLATSKEHRLIGQQCLVCVARLCLLGPPAATGDDEASSSELLLRLIFAEAVWWCAMQAVGSPLRQCPLDKYLAVMLRHVRRYLKSAALKDLLPPKSMDEILSLEKILKVALNKSNEPIQLSNSSLPSVDRFEGNAALSSHDLLIQINIVLLGFVRNLRTLIWALTAKSRTQKDVRIKRYYDVCSVFAEILEHCRGCMLPSAIYVSLQVTLSFPFLFRKSGYYTTTMQRQLEFCMLCTLSYVEAHGNQGSWALPGKNVESSRSLTNEEAGEVVPTMEDSVATAKGKTLLGPSTIHRMLSEVECIGDTPARRFLLQLANEVLGVPLPPVDDDGSPLEDARGDSPQMNATKSEDKLAES